MSGGSAAASTQEAPNLDTQGATSEDSSFRSWVWPYYTVNRDVPKEERTAACIFCSRDIACAPSMGTTALKRHLERCKKSEFFKPPKMSFLSLQKSRNSLSTRMVEAVICAQDWLRKCHKPLCMEEYIEQLEHLEAEPEPEIPGADLHRIIDIDE